MIRTEEVPYIHWNYYLALEHDLSAVSRFVEFSKQNFKTYSIELAHILLASASEVDVVLKLLCALAAPEKPRADINDYRRIMKDLFSGLAGEVVHIHRYRLELTPWDNWGGNTNPGWWKSYNNVKHERNSHFQEANLKNAMNSMAALHLSVTYYYKSLLKHIGPIVGFRDTTRVLQPQASLLRLREDYYNQVLIAE